MGSKRSWLILLVIFSLFLSSFGQSSNNFSRVLLDDLLWDFAFKELVIHRHTGALYKATLPTDLSGMEALVVRLRSGSFWARGANFSDFHIPPRIIPIPYVRRLAIVYQNLGNWSSSYYNVPGHTMVTPVVGFLAYNASNPSVNGVTKLNLLVAEDPISIRFPNFTLPEGSNSSLRCVRFDVSGSIEFSEMGLDNVCFTRNQGHFSLVVQSIEPNKSGQKKKERLWKWLVTGFALGFTGLVVMGLVGILVLRLLKMKKIGEMEKKADEGEAFSTIWIRNSKMPSATVIRTKPALEHDEAL